jgi:tellurite resistance protein TerB
MLGWIKQNVGEARKRVQDEIARYKNREFLEAVIAGCALVAYADGNITAEEKRKMLGFIQNSEELKVFQTDQVIAFFNQMAAKFEFDGQIGIAEALKIVGKLKKDNGAARLMVRVCALVAASDGDFSASEKQMLVKICGELGVNPADFDLPASSV